MSFQLSVNLNQNLRIQAQTTKLLTDLDQVVDANDKLLEKIPLDHPERPNLLISSSGVLKDRYQKTGCLENLDRAISIAEQATSIEKTRHKLRGHALRLQSELLEERNEPGDLATALILNRKTLEIPAEALVNRMANLMGLSNRLSTAFYSSGRLSDLEEAISLAREAVNLAPPNHSHRPAWLHNLALHLKTEAKVTEPVECLDEAIDLERQAIGSVGIDHIDLPMFLSGLSECLETRYRVIGATGDLEEAIQAAAGAVAVTEKGNLDRLAYLNRLSNCLDTRYQRSKNSADIEESIAAISEATVAAPKEVIYVTTLGYALFGRYSVAGDKKDFDESIRYAEKAVELYSKTNHWLCGCSPQPWTPSRSQVHFLVKDRLRIIGACTQDCPGVRQRNTSWPSVTADLPLRARCFVSGCRPTKRLV